MSAASDATSGGLQDTLPGGTPVHQTADTADLARRLLGTQLAQYEFKSLLGQGGMASVFLAQHQTLQRPCAIKILSPELLRRQPESVERFLAEARSAASLVHPHVVTVHNIGQSRGYHFIELEYIPGKSLQALKEQTPRMPILTATRYLLQAASALAAAHRQGLVHRDFKPANILVRNDGVAKLADFGLAKRVGTGDSGDRSPLTGTPLFMAPELFLGQPGGKTSDVYAVGVSYYLLLTGRYPYDELTVPRLARLHAEQPIPDPRIVNAEIPAEIASLIAQALAKDPAERPADGGAMHAELSHVFTTLRTLQSIVEEAVAPLPASLQVAQDRLEVRLSLPHGRAQTVFIEQTQATPWSTNIVRVYSICGPADPSYFRRALELNSQIPHGSLAIETIGGEPHFVMVHSYLRATCEPLELRHGVQEIAHWADRVERALTGGDQY